MFLFSVLVMYFDSIGTLLTIGQKKVGSQQKLKSSDKKGIGIICALEALAALYIWAHTTSNSAHLAGTLLLLVVAGYVIETAQVISDGVMTHSRGYLAWTGVTATLVLISTSVVVIT